MKGRKRPSHGTIVAYLALAVALGGTSYAAVTIDGGDIAKHSIKGRAIKSETIKGRAVKESTLSCAAIPGCATGGSGVQGPPGPPGTPGAPGTIANLTVSASRSAEAEPTAGIIDGWTESLDTAGAFNPATGFFDVPQPGTYLVALTSNQTQGSSSAVNLIGALNPRLSLVFGAPGPIGGIFAEGNYPLMDVTFGEAVNLRRAVQGQASIVKLIELQGNEDVSVRIFDPVGAPFQYDAQLSIALVAD